MSGSFYNALSAPGTVLAFFTVNLAAQVKSADFGLKLDPSLRCSVPADANANAKGVFLSLFLL